MNSVPPGTDENDFPAFAHELASDVTITGRLNFPSDVRIDGRLSGEVRAHDLLVVGRTGMLKADVYARHLVLFGKVTGNVRQCGLVELRAGSSLVGSLQAERVIVQDGAQLDADCEIGGSSEGLRAKPPVVLLDRRKQSAS